MKKKLLLYIVPLLLILGLLVSAIHANRQVENLVPPDVAGGEVNPVAPVPESSGETQDAAPIPAATSDLNSPEKEGVSETGPVSPPAPVKDSLATPAESTVSEAIPVNIAVIGKNGELLYGPGTVKLFKNNPRGVTAMGALEATGLPYDVSSRFPDFVEAVAGLRNKGQAGWLYKVNDEVPLVAADKKQVTANDRVIWWYSGSINDAPPSWDELVK